MKIAIMGSLARSLVNFRGPLLRRLKDGGHDVVAIAGEEDASVASELAAWGIEFQAVPFVRRGQNPVADWRLAGRLARSLKAIRPDVWMAYTIKPVIFGGWAAVRAGVPHRVALMTGGGAAFNPGGWKRRLLRIAVERLYRSALAGYHKTIFQNPDDLQEFVSLGLARRERTVRVWGTGVDLSEFAPAPLPTDAPRFLLIARLLREKGIREFSEAAAIVRQSHPDAVAQILGPFDPGPSGIVPEELNACLRETGVEYLGSASDVRPFLQQANVFVLPSYYREGAPRSIQEAMALGRPIITTDVPGCRETVVEGVNGFKTPPRSAPSLARAMLELAASAEVREHMGRESRRLACERFDVDRINDEMIRQLIPADAERAAA
ncbi:MAG: glycosyltransferase family 4 protein [Planctomyces sp.]|nr:glycosyltransferase family 4 protein [Planctomyces sp.]